jgi:hypothetical protein
MELTSRSGGVRFGVLFNEATRVKKILGSLDCHFWSNETEWTAKGLDTQAGRKILLDSLEQIVRNFRQGFEWHTDISMVRFVAAD